MHGFVFEEICLCLTSFAYGINACRLPKKTNIRVFRFSGIFSNSAISLRNHFVHVEKNYPSDIVLEYIIFAC